MYFIFSLTRSKGFIDGGGYREGLTRDTEKDPIQ